jgi:hypothetical protein
VRALPQVAADDFDIAVVRQLPPPQLPLGYKLETGPLQVVGRDGAFGHDAAVDKPAEHVPGNADDALIFTNADAELPGRRGYRVALDQILCRVDGDIPGAVEFT